jgi:glucose/arabinose dehydrogenase
MRANSFLEMKTMRLRSLLFFGCAVLTTCLLVLSAVASAQEVDVKPLAVAVKRAYPELRVRRPITLTHAGDGSGRKFVVSEQGVIHILPKDESGDEAAVFLDIEAKVDYEDKENEEGLLGLAFHPKFKENGEFFVYYTLKNPPHTSALSRFKVSKADPNKADPASEEEILRIPQPYWNHNGGGLMFGPEGYLYVALGDGGSGNDPHGHGQNLTTLLGSILRIDVDHTMPVLCIWLTRLSERSSVAPISFIVSSS